jgi:predicted DsbA family dithiol-disulfide isomerase
VTRLTALYVDFQDRFSHRLWLSLSLLPERETVEVRPFCLDTGRGSQRGPWERVTPSTAGLELLALAEFAREAGPERHLQFVDAAFAALHGDDVASSSLEAWLALGSRVALDLDEFTADSERWRAEVGLWHREAVDDLHVAGVPSLVFDDERVLMVKLRTGLTDPEAARRLLDDLADLSHHPVVEIRRP